MTNQRLPETAFRFVFCVYKNESAADEIGFLCVSYGQDDVGISHRQLWHKMLGMYVEHYEANKRERVTAERNASWINRASEALSKNVCAGYFNPTDQGPLGEIVDGISSSFHNVEERENLTRLEQLIQTGRAGDRKSVV